MKLIAINGFAESGKDTTYSIIKYLVEVTDNPLEVAPEERVERRAFADNLKIMAMYALGFDGEDEDLITIANQMKAGGSLDILVPTSVPRSLVSRSISGRKYLQHFGSRAREVFGDTFWVDQVLPCPDERAKAYSNPAALIRDEDWEPIWGTIGRNGERVGLPALGCVTDVRFPNEAERAREIGGVVLEVVRPSALSDGHSSEQPLPAGLVDYQIINDGTLLDLEERVREFLEWTEVL